MRASVAVNRAPRYTRKARVFGRRTSGPGKDNLSKYAVSIECIWYVDRNQIARPEIRLSFDAYAMFDTEVTEQPHIYLEIPAYVFKAVNETVSHLIAEKSAGPVRFWVDEPTHDLGDMPDEE